MSNFYGSRQGFSFYITAHFGTVEQMNEHFDDDNIKYNDYVLICSKPNGGDNGKLYRKGISKFEYIGQIAGPEGGIGKLNLMNTIEEIEKKYKELDGTAKYPMTAPKTGYPSINPTLIPGYSKSGTVETYNDTVELGYFTLIGDKDDTRCSGNTVYLAMKIPYLTPRNVNITMLEPTETASASASIVPDHKFSADFNFKIPRGYTGDCYVPDPLGSDFKLTAKRIRWDGSIAESVSLGYVKDYTGILIGKNLPYNSSWSKDNVISHLNSEYPNGLVDPDPNNSPKLIQGKIVVYGTGTGSTIGPTNSKGEFEPWCFAYDYDPSNTTKWFYIGSLAKDMDVLFAPENGNTKTPTNSTSKLALRSGGVWFKVQSTISG